MIRIIREIRLGKLRNNFLLVFVLAGFLSLMAYFLAFSGSSSDKFGFKSRDENRDKAAGEENARNPISRFALVADSENENDLLVKALTQAQGMGINFVIGLGDWSSVGTVDELVAAKAVFDKSGLTYYLTAGDHDLWDSRNLGKEALANYKEVFGGPSQSFMKNGVEFVILDNSDIYKGMDDSQWSVVSGQLSETAKLRFVFAHKTPFHPQSSHVMGEDSNAVANQAKRLLKLLEDSKVEGFFSGDLHFFAQFKSPGDAVKITTVGAVASERNFQGPRFATVTIFNDYSWKVEDVEVR